MRYPSAMDKKNGVFVILKDFETSSDYIVCMLIAVCYKTLTLPSSIHLDKTQKPRYNSYIGALCC